MSVGPVGAKNSMRLYMASLAGVEELARELELGQAAGDH